MGKIFNSIQKIGVLKEDNEITKNSKHFVVYEAIVMSIGGLVWGTIALILDRSIQSSIPFGYIILSFINISLFHKFKHFVSAQF